MSTPTKSTRRTPHPAIASAIDANRLPAAVTIEFTPNDLEVRIQPERYNPHGRKDGEAVELECELSHKRFTAVVGQLVYAIYACSDTLSGYLAPETVAKGEAYIQDRLRFKALKRRDSAKWAIQDAAMLEAASHQPVSFLLPAIPG